MIIHFGLLLDDASYSPVDKMRQSGIIALGPQSLLHTLEAHLGLEGTKNKNEHLRIEYYRQKLDKYLNENQEVFFKNSFEADPLGCAATILQMRDELLLAGWSFKNEAGIPIRLAALAAIEQQIMQSTSPLPLGFADRFVLVLKYIQSRNLNISEIQLTEPKELLPSHFNALFEALSEKGISIHPPKATDLKDSNDLNVFKKVITQQIKTSESPTLKGDGSLLIFKAARETEAASFLAKFFKKNPGFKPICVIPEKNRALDNAILQEGLPSMGILSASLARPSLQILKLVTTFLWQPIDPFKILEFVSLSIKPLDHDLATVIAGQIARQPGINGESWYIAISRFFNNLEDRANTDHSIDIGTIRNQYDFWFDRKRYDINSGVPKDEVIEIFSFLDQWAFAEFENLDKKNPSFLVLSEQAKRAKDLLESLPDSKQKLSQLELERIVRTIYEPPPVLYREKELGHFPAVYHSGAITTSADQVLWWNFVRNEQTHFFSRWYKVETNWLEQKNIFTTSPQKKNELQLWQSQRALLHCQKQLILILPEKVNGKEVYPHPIHDVMIATFKDLSPIRFNISKWEPTAVVQAHFKLPGKIKLAIQKLGKVKPFIQIRQPEKLNQRDYETLTSLESLFYYPYQYVFRHKIKLRKSSILSIVNDNTLMGNLSHRFFEKILEVDEANWTKEKVYAWIEGEAPRLLRREGAVLLMYGREPERIAFINRVQYAAWSLISLIQNNGWKVHATEESLEGTFEENDVRAKADIVLERGNEKAVIDLKWRGTRRRENIIRNEEDLQLVMYSKLVCGENEDWAHTAYFIIEEGKMIARNQDAFKDITPVSPDADANEINKRVWRRMHTTFKWRSQQLEEGKIEVRTKSTTNQIEDSYAEQHNLIDILEMKDDDAPFDDYRTLINLIQ